MRSFLPPCGDGTTYYMTVTQTEEFSPPYGDGTIKVTEGFRKFLFSPPYGDGTAQTHYSRTAIGFSPPYGENPLSHGLRRARFPPFVTCGDIFPRPGEVCPLRGNLVQGNGSRKSSPFGRAGAQRLRGFCGDKLKCYYDLQDVIFGVGFPSPCGDGTFDFGVSRNATRFSPPYGDGTTSMRARRMLVSFRPLTGMVHTKYITEYRKMEELNA